ncbi:threonine-phosphate decarboxylase CobD [Alkalimarinus coralli]|uniref:threonine-phosphate decarboxylase CobD n=1 Tax=Alkalimarinus coralli TaxID=2935863 RepID=UPI00202B4166|nr:threonine-phosphate decarboxylase CobD [Alkalimarinus coralli]
MLIHGGNLTVAAMNYGIPADQWLDLSTGLNPIPWTLRHPIPPAYIERLPYPDSELIEAAASYYDNTNILPVAGSQAAIQVLPKLINTQTVAVPAIGYEEHRYHWQQNGHQLLPYDPYIDDLLSIARDQQPSVMLVINPNNPTGHLYNRKELLKLLSIIEGYGGLLIIDEAFIDTNTAHSLSSDSSGSLIVLRSIGKFFGLPGIRTGFVIAGEQWLHKIDSALGPWTVSGPSQWIASQCLRDQTWQQRTIKTLKQLAAEQAIVLSEELQRFGVDNHQRTDFFISFPMESRVAEKLKTHFGKQGILLRKIELGTQRSLLRFGLCADDKALACVQQAASSFIL